MKLKQVKIRNFRKFTNLTVKNILESVRLIILVGPNGCGKSSFLDALSIWSSVKGNIGYEWKHEYHAKVTATEEEANHHRILDNIQVEFYNENKSLNQYRKCLRIRSAYRNDPEFKVDSIERVPSVLEEKRNSLMVNNDQETSRNYKRIVSSALQDLNTPVSRKKMVDDFLEEYLGSIRDNYQRLFPEIILNDWGNPMENGTFLFTKGRNERFEYVNLSSGEKAAFDLILDIIVSKKEFDDTVFCIDEPESHINARVQAELLSVLYELIPKNGQLIIATNSIGMMHQAKMIEEENPNSVVFFDFDFDFDIKQTVKPTKPKQNFWKKVYKEALDDLASLIAPQRVIICEGEPNTSRKRKNTSFDADCYTKIFQSKYPQTIFMSVGSCEDVIKDSSKLALMLERIVEGVEIISLVDRDDRSEVEKNDLAKEGVRVLSRRNIECYLLDDEILTSLAITKQKSEKVDELISRKKQIIKDKKLSPPDDMKKISGELYNTCQKVLELTKCGSDRNAFMRDTLAPLIKEDMKVYKELENDIFGKSNKK